jgi:isopentenyldiphosphate isomerase
MEYLDIVDGNDTVIGRASKEDVYKRFLRHRIVHVLVFNDKDEMALQLRGSSVPFCPRHWSTAVGGHVQSGETCEEAAMREYLEELGVVSPLEFFSKDFYTAERTPDKFLVTFKTCFNGPFRLDGKEVERVEFFPIGRIKRMVADNERIHPELLFLLKKYFYGQGF